MYVRCYYHSPLGELTLVSDGTYLTGVWFGQVCEKYEQKELSVFKQTIRWLDTYFDGEIPDVLPPLRLEGTAFRKEVWDILLEIPYGETVSYGEIAKQLAQRRGIDRMSAQAVGGAVGHNPISILVPCHRVVGSNGKMIGYGGGVNRKIKLLELEAEVHSKKKMEGNYE